MTSGLSLKRSDGKVYPEILTWWRLELIFLFHVFRLSLRFWWQHASYWMLAPAKPEYWITMLPSTSSAAFSDLEYQLAPAKMLVLLYQHSSCVFLVPEIAIASMDFHLFSWLRAIQN